jgi:hypothetical protein
MMICLVYRNMKNINGYTEHMARVSEAAGLYDDILPWDTRVYMERKVTPNMGIQKKELFDLIPEGWRPRVPIEGTPIRLSNDAIGMLECIPMYEGKDVIEVRFTPRGHYGPLQYFTMDGGFASSLTFDPEKDAMALSLMCMKHLRSVANAMHGKEMFGV